MFTKVISLSSTTALFVLSTLKTVLLSIFWNYNLESRTNYSMIIRPTSEQNQFLFDVNTLSSRVRVWSGLSNVVFITWLLVMQSCTGQWAQVPRCQLINFPSHLNLNYLWINRMNNFSKSCILNRSDNNKICEKLVQKISRLVYFNLVHYS